MICKLLSVLFIIIIIQMKQIQNDRVQNEGIRRNALIFGIVTVVIHIIACFMFGFFFKLPASLTGGQYNSIFIVFAYGALVIVGFGLLFSYLRKMVWTGMGFALLITALTVQFYFMFNCFWTKAVIAYKSQTITQFRDQQKTYSFWITNLDEQFNYFATLTGGFRCALSNLIAFSSIMGRAGPLQALFIVIFGTIGYELNRQILTNFSLDAGGTNSIFVFGGFMSLVIGLIRQIRQKQETTSTLHHQNYSANRSSATFALLGTLFVWIFFPILSTDFVNDITYSAVYTSPYSVIFSLCAATIASFMMSTILNNGVLIRDIIYGPIAGGVACSSASYWILNPVYAIVVGLVAGSVQVLIMNLVEKKVARERPIFHTFSFSLFGIQGLIGSVFAAIWNAGVRSNTYGFAYNFTTNQVFSWVMSLISLPMGLVFGSLAGGACLAFAVHRRQDHFDDFTYWVNDDGIRTFQEGAVTPDMGVRVKSHILKGRKAYL